MSGFKKIPIPLYPVLVFLLIWGGSLAVCEFLTLRHGTEFSEAYKEKAMLDEMEYWKVLACSQETATVYFVSKGYTDANVLTFANVDGQWEYDTWNTIWATSGTADGVIWPYFWHFIYAHPRFG
jgi:hypothetical protein